MTFLTERFDDALAFARQRHNTQVRKGTDIPYVGHLMSTAALVLEAGGDGDQAIAGLLHDTLEDSQYTGVTYRELVDRFGERVANIVRDCSDSEPGPGDSKGEWRPRKERYIPGCATIRPTPSWSPTPTNCATPGRSWPTTGSTARSRDLQSSLG